MADLQVTQEVVVVLNSFHNVDLFQRGYYQIHCHVEEPSKLTSIVECEVKDENPDTRSQCLFRSFVDKYTNTGVSKTIEVYYKHEEVQLKDIFIFKVHMLIDSSKVESQLPTKLQLVLDLFFGESSRSPATAKSLEHASTQLLTLNLIYGEAYHAYRSVLFDYFHLGAVNITVHSSITALRQPWSSSLKALHPIWSGKSGNVRQYTYNALFGKSSHIQPTQTLEYKHKKNALFMHRRLCLILLRLYEKLLASYHSVLTLIPDYIQMRISKVDVEAKLEVLNNELDMLITAEETYLRMGDDLYLLSSELNMLWMQFAEQFIYENVLLKRLIDEHHYMRTEHMKEAVFTQNHTWEALCTSLEMSTSQQARMFNDIKSSLYYQLIPPINIECALLDGDCSTMPIIFEDKYIPGCQQDKEPIDDVLTVEESIVDDFVDMDVSIQDSTGKFTKLSISESDTELPHYYEESSKELIRDGPEKPQQNNTFKNGRHHAWELSKDKIKSLTETDLTGPEYCSDLTDAGPEYRSEVTDVDDVTTVDDIKCVFDSLRKLKDDECDGEGSTNSDTANMVREANSIFYTGLQNEYSNCDDAEDTLLIEDLEAREKEGDVTGMSGVGNIIDRTASPGQHAQTKLWSCFPTKGGSVRRSPYKAASHHSLPYLPVPRKLCTRFQRAKENLEITSANSGYHYRLTTEKILVKPYFSEKVFAASEGVHLVVCVHGLDGNSGDLRLVRCFLELALPRVNFDFLMSEMNQEDTFCDIDEMTQRLVTEILEYIEEQSLDVVRLSFVGHSLGNIIIRNAVVHSSLYLFRNKLYTFLSLSGPHLGMQFHTSNLVSTGMWLMQKWKKCGSLVQLALNDSTDPRDSFMYRLSLTNGFQYFKNVLLVSSVQDHYVPFHSARIEMSKTVIKDNSEVGRVYKEMLDNIMNPLMAQEEVNIMKYSVHHPMPSSPNTFIGRAAHIAMLDSELFLEKFILCIAHKYFE